MTNKFKVVGANDEPEEELPTLVITFTKDNSHTIDLLNCDGVHNSRLVYALEHAKLFIMDNSITEEVEE